MHSLDKVRAEYRRLDALLGIDTSAIELIISKRALHRLGSFSVRRQQGSERLRITLSALVMEDEELFMDTIRHEYAHAAVHLLYPGQRHGHDALWKNICLRVGCRPQSRTPLSEQAAELRAQKIRYLVRCKNCGRESGYVRRGKVVETLMRGRGSALRCTACGKSSFELFVKQ